MKKKTKKTEPTSKIVFSLGEDTKRELQVKLATMGIQQNQLFPEFVRAFLTRQVTGKSLGLEVTVRRRKDGK